VRLISASSVVDAICAENAGRRCTPTIRGTVLPVTASLTRTTRSSVDGGSGEVVTGVLTDVAECCPLCGVCGVVAVWLVAGEVAGCGVTAWLPGAC
jgi:hypothetical protein